MPRLQWRLLCFGNPVRKPSDFPLVLFPCVSFGRFGQRPGCSATVSPHVCHCPCMFKSCLFSGWTMRWWAVYSSELWSLKDSYQIAVQGDTSACQANEARRARRSVFFFWGTKAFCVDLLLGNVLPFENNVEGKSCVIGFEMLWLIFFFWLNFIDSLFSVIGGNAPQSFFWPDGSVLLILISFML